MRSREKIELHADLEHLDVPILRIQLEVLLDIRDLLKNLESVGGYRLEDALHFQSSKEVKPDE